MNDLNSRRKREKEGDRDLFKEIMTENFPNRKRNLDIQINEAHRLPNIINLKRSFARHILIKLSKIKDKTRI